MHKSKPPKAGADMSRLMRKLAVARRRNASARRPAPTMKPFAPTLWHYLQAFEQIDDLKLQMPLFGHDRLGNQFLRLISAPANTVNLDGEDEETAPTEDEGAATFARLTFAQLISRYVWRAFLSAFRGFGYRPEAASTSPRFTNDLDTDDDIAARSDDEDTVQLPDFETLAARVFGGRGALASMAKFNDAHLFPLCPSIRRHSHAAASTTTAMANKQPSNKKIKDAETKLLEMFACWRLEPAALPCVCCAISIRVYLHDGVRWLQFSQDGLARQPHVVLNVGPLLYAPIAQRLLARHFNPRQQLRSMDAGELLRSVSSLEKTRRVQRMAFYRRVYAVHAAIHAIVSWLCARQRALHNATATVGEQVTPPPVVLVASRDFAFLVTRPKTLFLQTLLQRKQLMYQFL